MNPPRGLHAGLVIALLALFSACIALTRLPSGIIFPHRHVLNNAGMHLLRDVLTAKLNSELTELRRKYPSKVLEKHILVGSGLGQAVTTRVIETLMHNETSFIVGVTGGSSTSGDFAWPTRLVDWMSRRLHVPNVVLQNAAVGSTSQLVTAPCIQSLLGDHTDLLMWEFGMNDEHPEFMNGSQPIGQYYYRHRAAEAFIRQAIALNPIAMGFLHFWDLEIHTFQHPGSHHAKDRTLPNRSYHPTSSVLRYYDAVYNRYFAVDVIGFMWEADIFRNKSEILRDEHHPNDLTYNVAVDMLAYCLLKASVEFLKGRDTDIPIVEPNDPGSLIWAYPTLTHGSSVKSPYVLPSQRLLGHCLTAWRPAFSPQNTSIVVVQNHENVIDVGKAAPGRQDRQLRFVVGPCNTSRLVLDIYVPNIAFVMIDPGMRRGDHAIRHLQVDFEDTGTAPANVDVSVDIVGFFYSWVHKTETLIHRYPRRLSVCSSSNYTSLSRISIMQQIL